MECAVCRKDNAQVELFDGVFDGAMVKVCDACSQDENIPIIRRPSSSQVEKSRETNYSVRDRMERISGMRKVTAISDDQSFIQGRIARLRVPPKKQEHPDIFDNYYWLVNIARRRKKLSASQLALEVGTSKEVIEDIEKGIIPKDFEALFERLESFLGEKLLRVHRSAEVSFKRDVNYERDLLAKVKRRMSGEEVVLDDDDDTDLLSADEKKAFEEKKREKVERKEKITKGAFDFSDRKRLENVTLNELVEIKREKEKREKQKKEKEQKEEMMGEDLDLDDL